jgi:hypothetical protein
MRFPGKRRPDLASPSIPLCIGQSPRFAFLLRRRRRPARLRQSIPGRQASATIMAAAAKPSSGKAGPGTTPRSPRHHPLDKAKKPRVRRTARTKIPAMSSCPTTPSLSKKANQARSRNYPCPKFFDFQLGCQAIGPPLSIDRHYKNRCGQGKATANGFLMNRAGESLDSGAPVGRPVDKSVWIQIALALAAERALATKNFQNIRLTANCLNSSTGAMNKLWMTSCKYLISQKKM